MEKEFTFELTQEQKNILTPQEIAAYIKAFKNYDANHDGTMDEKEFKSILIDLGERKITDEEAAKRLADNDTNRDGVLSFSEFVNVMIKFRKDISKNRTEVVFNDDGTVTSIVTTKGGQGFNKFSHQQVAVFAKLISFLLKDDEECKTLNKIPIEADGDDLFNKFSDGILLAKLCYLCDNDGIDMRVLNKKEILTIFEINHNLKLGLEASKSLGIRLVGVNAKQFIDKTPSAILNASFQLLRLAVSKKMSLKDTPELFRLCKENEELSDLQKLKTEEILVRWINYHLMKNGQSRTVGNLGSDLTDSFALTHVLNRLDKGQCSLDTIAGDDYDKKAAADAVITNSKLVGCPDLITGEDICQGDDKVLTLFVLELFNTKHGLEELNEEEYAKCQLIDDDVEGTREERAFRLWINSLGIEGVYIDNLFDGLSDGYLLCRVVDKIDDKVVTWKNVDKAPKNYQFGNNLNLKEGIEACKRMGPKMIAIGSTEMGKKQKKDILACAWSICKHQYNLLLKGKTEKDLVAWANERVGAKATPITNLKDKTNLKNSKFLIQLLGTIEARGIDEELILHGDSEDDHKNNAKYFISLARSIGAVLFCVWDDLVNVNDKQMLLIFATLFDLSQTYGKEEQE